MNIEVPHMHLDIDTAVPLGLIMNELLSNSFKYAFNDVTSGEINLQIQTLTEGKYELIYSDNGPGLPADFTFFRSAFCSCIKYVLRLIKKGKHVSTLPVTKADLILHYANSTSLLEATADKSTGMNSNG